MPNEMYCSNLQCIHHSNPKLSSGNGCEIYEEISELVSCGWFRPPTTATQEEISEAFSERVGKFDFDRLPSCGLLPIPEVKNEGKKADAGKLRYSLIPRGTLKLVVRVLTLGAVKYDDDNWKQVPNARARYYDAAKRHIEAWWEGQIYDEPSEDNPSGDNEHHLAHAICCLLFLIWFDNDNKVGGK